MPLNLYEQSFSTLNPANVKYLPKLKNENIMENYNEPQSEAMTIMSKYQCFKVNLNMSPVAKQLK
jgi:hypothetical protein